MAAVLYPLTWTTPDKVVTLIQECSEINIESQAPGRQQLSL